ncbi:MAG: DUF1405 domain-containing protein [Candidatus ainarchaeum sp.]|nr:DUF1405 domain-containing protein [Candidatus ainarchaeum sp.]
MTDFFENNKFLFLLALTNFLIGFYSITYYFSQLFKVDFWFWLFVIDCPFYSILFGLILLLKIKKINISLLNFVVIVGSIKYAFWTLFVLFISGNFLNNSLIVFSHILFLLQIIVFYKYSKFKIKHLFIVLFWFLLNDFFDYVLFLHPFFETNFFVEVASFSIIMTIFVTIFVSIFFSKK